MKHNILYKRTYVIIKIKISSHRKFIFKKEKTSIKICFDKKERALKNVSEYVVSFFVFPNYFIPYVKVVIYFICTNYIYCLIYRKTSKQIHFI